MKSSSFLFSLSKSSFFTSLWAIDCFQHSERKGQEKLSGSKLCPIQFKLHSSPQDFKIIYIGDVKDKFNLLMLIEIHSKFKSPT